MDMDNPPPEEDQVEKMETDEKEDQPPTEGEGESKDKKKKRVKKEDEPNFEILSNISRIIPGQLKYISFPQGSRYAPVKKVPLVPHVINSSLRVGC